jgi:hypothetical protein
MPLALFCPAPHRASLRLGAALLIISVAACDFEVDPVRHDGDAVIRTLDDVIALKPVEVIGGDLIVRGTSLTGLSLDNLASVHGVVIIEGNDRMLALHLPRLSTARGVRIADNPVLYEIERMYVDSHGGELVVRDNPDLLQLELSGEHCSRMSLSHNASLREAELTAIDCGSVVVVGNPAMKRLNLGSDGGDGGAVTIADDQALTDPFLSAASMISLDIHSCPSLRGVNLTKLAAVASGLRIERYPLMYYLAAPALVRVAGAFVVRANPQLRRCAVTPILDRLFSPPRTVDLTGDDETACTP